MKKHYFQILVIGMVGALIFGCAAQKLQQSPTSFTPRQFPAEHYTHKVDNFIVVLDASSSMGEWYNGQTKFNLARNIVDRMNQTIPDLKMNGALRTFGHSPKLSREKTVLFYGLTAYSQAGFQAGLDKVTRAGGTTPIASAINAATCDLASAQGKIAVIVVSDGKDPDDSPVKAAQAMKGKFDDRLCIYTILVGDNAAGKALMEQVAQAGECGFSVNADDIASADSTADFVEKVFLTHHLDSDGDGVTDDKDLCPDTPSGLKVDENGCWKLVVLADVLFDFDKYNLKPEGHAIFNKVVGMLNKHPFLKLKIRGHTDNFGTMEYNVQLSKKRAQASLNYLLEKSISSERLSISWHSFTIPKAGNETTEGRALNRRVEFKFSK